MPLKKKESTSVEALSDDVVVLIFQLTLKDLRTWAFLLRVSHRWNRCGHAPPALFFVKVMRPRLSLDAYGHLAALQGLRSLTLDHTTREPEVEKLSALRTLQVLDMSGLTAFAGGTLSVALQGMSVLKDLELGGNRNQTIESLAAIARSAPSLTALKMSQTQCDDSVLSSLSVLTNLSHFECFGCGRVTDVGLSSLTVLQSLESLYIGECGITREGLQALSSLPQLTTLNIAGSPSLQDDALEEVGKLSASLSTLDLSDNTTFTDTGLQHLTSLTKLENLNLAHCTGITDIGFGLLTSLTALKNLGIGGCTQLTDAALEPLQQLPLEQFKLARSANYTDEALVHVSRYSRLQALHVTRIRTFTDRGVAALGALTSLRELTLSGLEGPTDEGIAACLTPLVGLEVTLLGGIAAGVKSMAALATLPVLRTVDLNHCPGVNDAGLQVFARPGGLMCLEALNLSGCAISDAGVEVLVHGPARPLVRLHRLAFSDCIMLTDAALRTLAEIPYLQSLLLNGCIEITDAGVQALADCPSMERLALGGCLGVSTRLQRTVAAVSATRSMLALPSSARSYPRETLRPRMRRFLFRSKVMFATMNPFWRVIVLAALGVPLAFSLRKIFLFLRKP